VFIKLMH